MGIIPEERGKGLENGCIGKLYHGGTHGENKSMKKLYELYGCKLFCEMEEWCVNLKGGTPEPK